MSARMKTRFSAKQFWLFHMTGVCIYAFTELISLGAFPKHYCRGAERVFFSAASLQNDTYIDAYSGTLFGNK